MHTIADPDLWKDHVAETAPAMIEGQCSRRRAVSALAAAVLGSVLLVITLVPRWSSLDALVTPDEPLWVARSANFYEALSSRGYEDTYQASHPGVSVMWLGALGHRLVDPGLPERTTEHIETADVRERVLLPDELPVERLVSLRKPVIVANAVAIVAMFLCLIPLVGRWPAFISVSYLALDPMQIGFSRLLHLDGLSTNLLLVTLISFTWHLQRRSNLGLVVSGVAAGLALLTRSVNGIVLPVVIMALVIHVVCLTNIDLTRLRKSLQGHLALTLIWATIALSTVFALWPALWVAPIDTLSQLIRGGSELATEPHTRQVLFQGDVISSDPGLIYYPVVLVYRTNPLTLVGLLLAAVAFVCGKRELPELNRRLYLNLIVFSALYIIVLSLAAKKLDRYLLPSLAALHLVAALGTLAVVRLLAGNFARSGARVTGHFAAAVATILLVGQTFTAAQWAPYYITYVSPLTGGADGARDEISLGWGEGGKAVAEAIRSYPEMEPELIKGGAWPATIHYYLPHTILPTNWDLGGVGAGWFIESHYVIVTEPEIQRQLFHASMIRWFETQEPILTVWDDGRIYARVYDIADVALPAPYYLAESSIYTWGEVRLVAARFREEIEPGAEFRVRLSFETNGGTFDYWIDAEVVDGEDEAVGTTRKRLRAEDVEDGVARSIFEIVLPDSLPIGEYTVRMSVRDHETGDQVTGVHAVTGQETERSVALGTFAVVEEISEPEP